MNFPKLIETKHSHTPQLKKDMALCIAWEIEKDMTRTGIELKFNLRSDELYEYNPEMIDKTELGYMKGIRIACKAENINDIKNEHHDMYRLRDDPTFKTNKQREKIHKKRYIGQQVVEPQQRAFEETIQKNIAKKTYVGKDKRENKRDENSYEDAYIRLTNIHNYKEAQLTIKSYYFPSGEKKSIKLTTIKTIQIIPIEAISKYIMDETLHPGCLTPALFESTFFGAHEENYPAIMVIKKTIPILTPIENEHQLLETLQ
eukprot:CAMPEP_0117428650 /NCGR_PEP_ID=MMETSP0758-20121206/8308_1 /TAXON_ID=63605 /ORGANISM="Percolomonas cosmopolitus, Strain AE-1 (ATCC 50343)" /LENGTH=258 /DNA_ID=CAMNT_0005215119 /DNA_START=166 /DNA_END=939 /DNA_ORIENTATION=+